MVVAEDPDVITLQEVRLDTTFAAPDSKIAHWIYDSNGMAEHMSTFTYYACMCSRSLSVGLSAVILT